MAAPLHRRPQWRRAARLRRRGLTTAAGSSVRGRLLAVTAVAIAPIVLFASAIALQHAYGADGFVHAAAWMAAATMPVLAGIVAILVVSIAAETLILRWLLYLERLTRAYSRGRYSVRPQRLEKAPSEFRSLGVAVADMASAVEDRDHALRSAITEQSVLLREVHHRVKNNLQIVGSLLSLQASRSPDPGVKQGLAEALVRIDAMALSQRFMQPAEAEAEVASGELFTALATQVKARLGRGPRRLFVQLEVTEFTIGLELGSRLVLIAAEALLQAYRGPGPEPLRCVIGLRPDGDDLVLWIKAQNDADAFTAPDDTISTSLIDGYVRQVHGVRTITADVDSILSVRAPRS